jgi:uncharacterized protein (UPF0332 family)
MISLKKLLLISVAVLLSAMLLLSGCSGGNHGGVIGTVNGQNVYQDEMDYYFSYYYQYYYENYYNYFLSYEGVDLLDEASAQEWLGQFENAAWEYTVKAAIIQQVAKDRGIVEEDSYLQDILPWGNYKSIKTGTMNAKLTEIIRQELLADKTVSDEDARAAYDADPSAWNGRQTSHILIQCDVADPVALEEARAEAQALIEQLNDGADFAELAQEHSDDGSAANGGKIDAYININGQEVGTENGYYEEYVAAAYQLSQTGDYTQSPVQSSAGFHIIKIDDIWDSFDDVKDAVSQTLKTVTDEEVAAKVEEILTDAYNNAEINQKFDFKYYVPVDNTVPDIDVDANGDETDNGDDNVNDDPESLPNQDAETDIDTDN